MKRLKSLIILALAALFAMPLASQTTGNEKSFGIKTGYISRNESMLAGIWFRYSFSEHFRLAPDAQVAFRHNDRDALQIDLDCHVPFRFTDGAKVSLYPIAGINYSSWNRHLTPEQRESDDDVSTRNGYFGLNFGAGTDLRCSETLKLTLDARYSLVKSNSGIQISLGIGYIF